MSISTRQVDAEGRIVLPPLFIGKAVTLAVVSDSEVRVGLARPTCRRPSFQELIAQVNESNLPEKVNFGPPAGEEQL